MKSVDPIYPPATLGVLGGGQLGRMFGLAARRMGYGFAVFTPETNSPAGQIADVEVVAPFEDESKLKEFARHVAAVTIEFENIPSTTLDFLSKELSVQPRSSVLHTTQHRKREKEFLSKNGFPITPFVPVKNVDDLDAAEKKLGLPFILKTAGFGYDGKGQERIENEAQLEGRRQGGIDSERIAEKLVRFKKEFSVIGARNAQGEFAVWGPIENRHAKHVLDISFVPADIDEKTAAESRRLCQSIMEKLGAHGILCVECFLTDENTILVNELAPRPHNSGHLTIEGSFTSQFEQQVRALCGLPLGSTDIVSPAAMANLLGDRWENKGCPNWKAALSTEGVHLHLYGKDLPKKGRKMGHLTGLAETAREAVKRVTVARDQL